MLGYALLSMLVCCTAVVDGSDVNGGYTDWSVWSACSVTCGDGSQSRTRTCKHPAPEGTGTNCSSIGLPSETQVCHTAACPAVINCATADVCKNGGNCTGGANGVCTCAAVFTGQTCETASLGACTGSGDKAACPGEITNGECVGGKCACKSGFHAEVKQCVKDPGNSVTTNGLTIACTLAALTFAVIQKLF